MDVSVDETELVVTPNEVRALRHRNPWVSTWPSLRERIDNGDCDE